MRIHTSLPADQVRAMLHDMPGVTFHRFSLHGSRTHDHAFEVSLEGTSARRAQSNDHQAATWDEWGIFLGRVFRADPRAKAGDVYADRRDFLHKTGKRYTNTFTAAAQHRDHDWRGTGYRGGQECVCGAVRRWA